MKILFLDIDGTVLSHTTNSIPPSALNAINEARRKGVKVFGCTGRHTEELKKLPLDELYVDGWITMNGALNYVGDEVVSEYPIEREDISILYQGIQQHSFPVQFLEKDEMYMNMYSKAVIEGLKNIHSEPDPIKPLERILENKIYMFIPWITSDIFDPIQERMIHTKGVRWNEYAVDCFHKECGKRYGIEDILAYFNISKEDAGCVGDADNDLSMLEGCTHSVAMGNACDRLKEKADYVCRHIDNHGLQDAIEYLMNLA